MPHSVPLITTMVAAIVLAFALGAGAHRLRLSPLVGYLLAGVAIGPFTPGYVGDLHLASQLAEIGVILLMFGVGLHFSLDDLMKVRLIAVPGAVVQIAIATLMGWGLAALLGWSSGGGAGLRAGPVGRQHGGAAAGAGTVRICSRPNVGASPSAG